jgi:hypothetical protein
MSATDQPHQPPCRPAGRRLLAPSPPHPAADAAPSRKTGPRAVRQAKMKKSISLWATTRSWMTSSVCNWRRTRVDGIG